MQRTLFNLNECFPNVFDPLCKCLLLIVHGRHYEKYQKYQSRYISLITTKVNPTSIPLVAHDLINYQVFFFFNIQIQLTCEQEEGVYIVISEKCLNSSCLKEPMSQAIGFLWGLEQIAVLLFGLSLLAYQLRTSGNLFLSSEIPCLRQGSVSFFFFLFAEEDLA